MSDTDKDCPKDGLPDQGQSDLLPGDVPLYRTQIRLLHREEESAHDTVFSDFIKKNINGHIAEQMAPKGLEDNVNLTAQISSGKT